VVDLPGPLPDGGRSADLSPACRDGASTAVWVFTSTVVDLPRMVGVLRWHSGHRRDRPPDGGRCAVATRRGNVGRSATVRRGRRQIDHRRRTTRA